MAELTTQEYQDLLAKFKTLKEQDRYDLWADLWEGVHRLTFAQVKAPEPPPPPPAQPSCLPPPPPGAGVMESLTEDDLRESLSQPPSGARYVLGRPPMQPVMRPLKQSLYDTLIVPESGHVGKVTLFDDCHFFPNHTQKTEKDTNMTLSGQLGHPLEYDLRWIDLKFEKFSHPDDLRRVLKGLTFRWVRGQSVPWLRVTLSGFEPYLAKDELGPGVSDEEVRRLLAAYDGDNKWTRFRASVLSLDGLPQRIGSSECFRVEVSDDVGLGELHGPVRLKVILGDTLFTAL
jgi:hypothetical protein